MHNTTNDYPKLTDDEESWLVSAFAEKEEYKYPFANFIREIQNENQRLSRSRKKEETLFAHFTEIELMTLWLQKYNDMKK